MGEDTCGHETGAGTPCELPASKPDGRCHHHTDTDERANGGREPALDESDHDDILEAAKIGASKAGCARAAGVGEATLQRYLDDNPDFRSAFTRARARGEQRLLTGPLYESDAPDEPDMNGQHARFLLASSFDYKKTEKHEVTGEDGDAIDVNLNRTVVGSDE